jgi:hypothetical protein
MKKITMNRVIRGGWNGLNWSHYSNEWSQINFYEANEYQKLLNVLGTIQDKLPTLKKGSTILIDKNSEIPRPKLKEFIADNGYKKVTLMSKANIIAVRRETVKQIQNRVQKTMLILDKSDVNKICSKVDVDAVYLDISRDESNMDQEYWDVKGRCTSKTGYVIDGYRNKKQDESLTFILSLIGTKATLVYDDVLLGEINSEGLDLDDDIYETVKGMLVSKDTDTFNLGIEMLSNINIESNLFRVSLLMNYCFNQTKRLNALSQIKNNNFKSLVSYLQANGIRWNQQWDSFGLSMLVKFSGTVYEQNIHDYIVDNLNAKFHRLNIKDCKEIVKIVFK